MMNSDVFFFPSEISPGAVEEMDTFEKKISRDKSTGGIRKGSSDGKVEQHVYLPGMSEP